MNSKICIFDYRTGVEYIKDVYQERLQANPRYSLRSFASKLGLDQSLLTRYLAQERTLSYQKTEMVAQKLGLSQAEAQFFKLLTGVGDRGDLLLMEKISDGFLHERFQFLSEQEKLETTFEQNQKIDLRFFMLYMLNRARPTITVEDAHDCLQTFLPMSLDQVKEMLGYFRGQDLEQTESRKLKFILDRQKFSEADRDRLNFDLLEAFKNALLNREAVDFEMHGCLIPTIKGNREKIQNVLKQISVLIRELGCSEDEMSPDDEVFVVGSAMLNLTNTKLLR